MWTGYKYKVRSCVIMKGDHTHTHTQPHLHLVKPKCSGKTHVLIKTDTSAHTHWRNLQDVLHVIIKWCGFGGLERDEEWRRWLCVGSIPVLHPLLVCSLICHQVTGKVAGICRALPPSALISAWNLSHLLGSVRQDLCVLQNRCHLSKAKSVSNRSVWSHPKTAMISLPSGRLLLPLCAGGVFGAWRAASPAGKLIRWWRVSKVQTDNEARVWGSVFRKCFGR